LLLVSCGSRPSRAHLDGSACRHARALRAGQTPPTWANPSGGSFPAVPCVSSALASSSSSCHLPSRRATCLRSCHFVGNATRPTIQMCARGALISFPSPCGGEESHTARTPPAPGCGVLKILRSPASRVFTVWRSDRSCHVRRFGSRWRDRSLRSRSRSRAVEVDSSQSVTCRFTARDSRLATRDLRVLSHSGTHSDVTRWQTEVELTPTLTRANNC
jgi:hypothetical protein